MQRRIPAVFMRGGSSKAVFFHENHLPQDNSLRDKVILAAFGSPDPNKRQIDGMGGAVSSTSKVAIIGPSESPNFDVNYNFGQVAVDLPVIDYKGNCGNISSVVGVFAIEEGLVKAVEPITKVRIYQENTKKLILAEIPVENGILKTKGDFVMDGVPGSGAKITLHFFDPGGSVTGKLLPTGQTKNIVNVPGKGRFTVSIVDAANPLVFVQAKELGLEGTEIYEIDSSEEIRETLEAIRARAAVMIGLASTPEEASAKSQSVPKVAFVTSSKSYKDVTGRLIRANEIDLVGRIMSMGTLHKSFALTGAVCTCGATKIPGTVVNEVVSQEVLDKKEIKLGHPGGIISIEPEVVKDGTSYKYIAAGAGRTARRLMEGYVCLPEKLFREE